MNPAMLAAASTNIALRTVTCPHCHRRQVVRAPGSAHVRCRECGRILDRKPGS